MNIYKILWKPFGRPFTYIRRDFWHEYEIINIVFFVSIGFFSGLLYPRIIRWIAEVWWHPILGFALIYFAGVLQGHFYWTERYIKGQKVGDSVALSYLAGVFDGEGSIIIKVKHYPKSKRGWREHLSHTVMSQMGSNSKEAILWFYNRFGGSIWNDKAMSSRKNFNQWHWEVTGDKCSNCLKALYPFLRIKKYEAKVAIDFQDGKDSMSLNEREAERHYLHSLKGNKRILKDYGIPHQEGK